MPTYEYACEACGKEWEAEQRISEPRQTTCPACGEEKAKRLISGSRFVLKGGGWYADGYGNSKPAAASSDSSSSSAAPSAPSAPSAPAASTPSSGSSGGGSKD